MLERNIMQFKLFNKVYLINTKEDIFYQENARNIIIGHRLANRQYPEHMQLDKHTDLETMVLTDYNHNLQNFINDIISHQGKIYIHTDNVHFIKLQILLWKSILAAPSAERVYRMHLAFMEQNEVYAANSIHDTNASSNQSYNIGYGMFSAFYEESVTVVIPRSVLSIEYLLPYIFSDSVYRELLDKEYKRSIKDKIYRHIVDCKETIIRYGYYIPELLGYTDTKPGDLIRILNTDNRAKWIIDESFNTENIAYCIEHYSLEEVYSLYRLVFMDVGTPVCDRVIANLRALDNGTLNIEDDIRLGIESLLLHFSTPTEMNTYWASYLFGLINKDEKEKVLEYLLKE